MGLFRRSKPEWVVKTYGRDSLVGLLTPLLAAVATSMGVKLRMQSDVQVIANMERDAILMSRQGYRIASSMQYEIPFFGVTYQKVTYELVNPREGTS